MSFKNLSGLIVGLIILIFSIFLTSKIFGNTQANILVGMLTISMFYFISYLFIATALCRLEYDVVEKNRYITLNKNMKNITVIDRKTKNKETLNHESIKNIELYYSWNTNPFSSDLGYTKFTMTNERIIYITQDIVHQSEIQNIFKNKVIKEKSKFMNRLQ